MRGPFVCGSREEARSLPVPISSLVGEMSGRTEGGVKDRYYAVVILGRSKERSDARRQQVA